MRDDLYQRPRRPLDDLADDAIADALVLLRRVRRGVRVDAFGDDGAAANALQNHGHAVVARVCPLTLVAVVMPVGRIGGRHG